MALQNSFSFSNILEVQEKTLFSEFIEFSVRSLVLQKHELVTNYLEKSYSNQKLIQYKSGSIKHTAHHSTYKAICWFPMWKKLSDLPMGLDSTRWYLPLTSRLIISFLQRNAALWR